MPVYNPPAAGTAPSTGGTGVTVDAEGFFSFAGSDSLPIKVIKGTTPSGGVRLSMIVKDGIDKYTFHKIEPQGA